MVGGKVVETLDCGDRMWVNVRGTGSEHRDECALYVERTAESRSISEGDSIWWQGDFAFWTPANAAFEDRRLRRVGFSGVRRPASPVSEHDDHPDCRCMFYPMMEGPQRATNWRCPVHGRVPSPTPSETPDKEGSEK